VLLPHAPLLLLLPTQVLFNPDYKETDHDEEIYWVAGGDDHEVFGLKYVVHKYCGPLYSDTWWVCIRAVPGRIANYHWPQFSLRPGVWRMSNMTALGPMETANRFEEAHGPKYVAQGLKTAFLPDVHAVHLAISATYLKEKPYIVEETYAKHGLDMAAKLQTSAYVLKGTAR
jgi:hypothetical protein